MTLGNFRENDAWLSRPQFAEMSDSNWPDSFNHE